MWLPSRLRVQTCVTGLSCPVKSPITCNCHAGKEDGRSQRAEARLLEYLSPDTTLERGSRLRPKPQPLMATERHSEQEPPAEPRATHTAITSQCCCFQLLSFGQSVIWQQRNTVFCNINSQIKNIEKKKEKIMILYSNITLYFNNSYNL